MLPDKAQFYVNIFRILLPNLIKKPREIQEKQPLTTLSTFITLQSVIYALATRPKMPAFKVIVTYLTKILNTLFQCYF